MVAPETFRARYCRQHGLPEPLFERTLLPLVIPPPAKLFYWLLALSYNYRQLDGEFLRAIGNARSWREFNDEVADFRGQSANVRFVRRVLRVRVSTHRVRRIFSATMGQA